MFSILEICAFISYIYFKTIVIDNLHLFRKWRGSSPFKNYVAKNLSEEYQFEHFFSSICVRFMEVDSCSSCQAQLKKISTYQHSAKEF